MKKFSLNLLKISLLLVLGLCMFGMMNEVQARDSWVSIFLQGGSYYGIKATGVAATGIGAEKYVIEDMSNILKKDGYILKGWSNEANGKVDYVVGDTIKLAEDELKYIYAVWEPDPNWNPEQKEEQDSNGKQETEGVYKPKSANSWITLYPLGGSYYHKGNNKGVFTGVTADGWNDANNRHLYIVKDMSNIIKKDGYILKGWSMEEGGEVEYNVGDKIQLAAGYFMKLYAVWEEDPNWDPDQKVEQDINVDSTSNEKAENTLLTNLKGGNFNIKSILQGIVKMIIKVFELVMPIVASMLK